MKQHIRPAILLLLLFTIITGVIYPLAVTGIAQVFFPAKANGSIIYQQGRAVGSSLIGQQFTSPKYFWGRLSATAPFPYNSAASSGSNYGPLAPGMFEATTARLLQLRNADSTNKQPVPVDLVTASGSGLDSHISVASALYQSHRVAKERNISEEQMQALIKQFTEQRTFGFLGEPRVNVLLLNLALDDITTSSEGTN